MSNKPKQPTATKRDALSIEDTVRAQVRIQGKAKVSGIDPYASGGLLKVRADEKPRTDLRELSKAIKAQRAATEAKEPKK